MRAFARLGGGGGSETVAVDGGPAIVEVHRCLGPSERDVDPQPILTVRRDGRIAEAVQLEQYPPRGSSCQP